MKQVIYTLIFLITFFLQADGNRSFKPVEEGKTFRFPYDHKPHLGFKTEWWYYTGFLESEESTIGVQFTLFKIELEPGNENWEDSPILMVTHLGIANVSEDSFESKTDSIRLYPGLADFTILGDGFRFRSKGKNLYTEYSIINQTHNIRTRSNGLDILKINVRETMPILLQGNQGFSRKDYSDLASYYYSIPELKGKAEIFSQGKKYKGNISLWLDREFSSKFLQKEKKGWDWVHFTMENGDKYVAFQVRDMDPEKNFYYGMRLKNGEKTISSVSFSERRKSRLTSQNTYPTEWDISIGGESFRISAMIFDSEMKGILPYWEGPIHVKNLNNSETGRGYLEMTGYGKSLPDWL